MRILCKKNMYRLVRTQRKLISRKLLVKKGVVLHCKRAADNENIIVACEMNKFNGVIVTFDLEKESEKNLFKKYFISL